MEGIFYIWIGETYQISCDHTWDDDPDSPTYGEEFCFEVNKTEWYMESIIDGKLICDGEKHLSHGRPYDHIAFSLKDAKDCLPPDIIIY